MLDLYAEHHCRFGTFHDYSLELPPERGQGLFRSVSPRKGMMLFMEDYRLNREVTYTTENIWSPLGFSFCLSGNVNWTINGTRKPFTTEKGLCELLYNNSSGGWTHYGTDEPILLLNILICPKLLQSYFDAPIHRADGTGVLCPQSIRRNSLYRKNPIPDAIRHVLNQLLRAPCRTVADALYIQGKVMELVAFQLNLLEPSKTKANDHGCMAEEEDLILRTKALLRSRMQSPPSLPRLARIMGTNETKLKRCFLRHCGTTVYGYLRTCRMERACELLKDHRLTMSQIASELGYSERTHFSRAFSRYFGSPPAHFRHKHCLTAAGTCGCPAAKHTSDMMG